MKSPRPYHLPHAPRGHAWRCLGETSYRVPVLDAIQAERLWEVLEQGARSWRRLSLEQRVEALTAVLENLRRRGPGPWRSVLAASTGLSPPGVDAAWEATFAPHTREALEEALQAERIDTEALRVFEMEGRLPLRVAHVLAGNVLAPTLSVLLRGWLLGSAQWLRPAEREPFLAACLLHDLGEYRPDLAACTAVLWWPHEDRELEAAVLGRAGAVTIQGSDAAIAAIQAKQGSWPLRPRLLAYGSRWSAAMVAGASLTPKTASAIARDVALFDQQGCLSPTLVFAERTSRLPEWCAQLGAALDAEEGRMPRGSLPAPFRATLRHWQENARLALAEGTLAGLWASGTRWGVTLQSQCAFAESPLDRHVPVVPFDQWQDVVRAAGDKLQSLQGLAVALDGWSAEECAALLDRLRPTRVAPVGHLQDAPLGWPQDHRAPFRSLLAWD